MERGCGGREGEGVKGREVGMERRAKRGRMKDEDKGRERKGLREEEREIGE